MSLLRHRAVAALFGATVVWRLLNGVGALVRWLWLGERLGNGPMSLFLVSVVVAPVLGGVGGDAALRRGIWSATRRAHGRRLAALVAVALLPVCSNLLLSYFVPTHDLLLPLRGLVTLVIIAAILLGGRRLGRRSGRDE